MPARIKKLIVVVIMTIIIWAWAYLEQVQEIPAQATAHISPVTSNELYVRFVEAQAPVQLDLILKGPAAKIAEFRTATSMKRLQFDFNAEKEVTNIKEQPFSYFWDIQKFIAASSTIKQFGLVVESCEPKEIEVRIEKLVKKPLTIHCLDENGIDLIPETIDRTSIEMFVPARWRGDSLKAFIKLTPQQVAQARKEGIAAQPYIILNPAEPEKQTHSDSSVRIKLSPTKTPLKPQPFQPTRIKYVISKNLVGKILDIQLSNENVLTSVTQFQATDAALAAYEKMSYHLLIEINESDIRQKAANGTVEIAPPVIYNFPTEYVQTNEIKLSENESPRKAKIILVLAADKSPAP
jgi:hypothetical protein